jgi:hypothetical protein
MPVPFTGRQLNAPVGVLPNLLRQTVDFRMAGLADSQLRKDACLRVMESGNWIESIRDIDLDQVGHHGNRPWGKDEHHRAWQFPLGNRESRSVKYAVCRQHSECLPTENTTILHLGCDPIRLAKVCR